MNLWCRCGVVLVWTICLILPRLGEAQEPGSSIVDCVQCPEMVVLPPGEFQMGDSSGSWSSQWGPAHSVKIIYAFGVSRYEITFEQWDHCVADSGCRERPSDEEWGRGRRPVIHVSWHDAVQYTIWLSKRTGAKYRLLTEAEWEYAARAGNQSFFTNGDDYAELCHYANHGDRRSTGTSVPNAVCDDGYPNETAPVGSFRPNDFGLYDMAGNVWEWVADCWAETYEGAPDDGSARTVDLDCSDRGMRSGSWRNRARAMSPMMRNYDAADATYFNLGFRVARQLP